MCSSDRKHSSLPKERYECTWIKQLDGPTQKRNMDFGRTCCEMMCTEQTRPHTHTNTDAHTLFKYGTEKVQLVCSVQTWFQIPFLTVSKHTDKPAHDATWINTLHALKGAVLKKLLLIIYSPPCHPRCPCLSFFSQKERFLMKTFQDFCP